MKKITFQLDNEKSELTISIDEEKGLFLTLKDSEFSHKDNFCSVKLTSFEGETIAGILQSMAWDEGVNENVRNQPLIARENAEDKNKELLIDLFDYMKEQPLDNIVGNLLDRLQRTGINGI